MNKPLGNKLINRIASPKEKRRLLAQKLRSLPIAHEKIVELWNIATGAYSPLSGFLNKKDFLSVLNHLSLKNNVFWPIPIILDIDADERKKIFKEKEIFLKNFSGKIIGLLEISEIYPFPKTLFAKKVFGTTDVAHPGVAKLKRAKPYLIGGDITWIGKPLRTLLPYLTPRETRTLFQKKHWKQIVAFHTRNVPHLGHEHIQKEGLKKTDGILVHPLIGSKKKGDFRNEVVAKAYRYFVAHILPRGKAVLSFLPYNAYYAGPREALLTAVIRKNFGCTHFIVGRDHTGVGNFYTLQNYAFMIGKYNRAMGIKIFHFGKAFYCTRCKTTAFEDACPHGEKYRVHSSGTLIRNMLTIGKAPPAEMLRREISRILLKEKKLFV
ncbi:MAG: sulfate adenylyltransferase [Candidatus Liptonbacteria bacterium]|nr:sulfate adenylyltransferase [Candidatus Liptonbacteria bacterium]